ncbi:MAG: serine hydrolase [Acidobacteria bacterium]|nr:serine hydrolase [Acidobacteriota bacterium]
MTSRRFQPVALLLTLALYAAPIFAAEKLPVAVPEAVGLSGERLDRLTQTMQQYVDNGQLSGSVVLVARHGQVAYFRAFGQRDVEAKSPMADDAIFRIASQTKALVSTAILMLQEEGKLLISDPAGRYLPEFENTKVAVAKQGGGYDIVDAVRPITIRQLLTHTSGSSYGHGPAADKWKAAGIQDWYFAHRDEPIRKTIARLAALPFDAQPGEKYIYGYNTDILGAVVEAASGQPLDVFLRTRIFEPLKMQDTHFYLPNDKRNRLATVYSAKNGKIARAPTEGTMQSQGAYVDGPRKSFSGGAGLLSTATDYARFLQMMLNGGELDGTRLLSPKTVELMTTDHLQGLEFRPGQGFGLGFSVVKDLGERGLHGSVGEYGWGGAYHSTYWVDPAEDMVVVYFTQLLPAGGLDDHGKLRALIYQAIVD